MRIGPHDVSVPPKRRVVVALALPALLAAPGACSRGDAMPFDAAMEAPANDGAEVEHDEDRGGASFVCPQDGVRGRGRHRLFVQGHNAPARADGSYPFLHEWRRGGPSDGQDARLCDDRQFVNDANGDGVWQPGEEPRPLGPEALVHGEHFLVGVGAFAEFWTTLCDDITGEVVFYIPNFDQAGSVTRHELFVVHEGRETLIADAVDDVEGFNGYKPFVAVRSGMDPAAQAGDRILLRSTNVSGAPFSVMVWQPPSEYESWITVEVP